MADPDVKALLAALVESQQQTNQAIQALAKSSERTNFARVSRSPIVRDISPVLESGENMAKPRTKDPYIQQRGCSVRVLIYQDVLLADGSLGRHNVAYPLDPGTEEEQLAQARAIKDRVTKLKTPITRITVEQFICQRYLPERVAKLSISARTGYESILRNHVIQAYGTKQLRDLDAQDLQRLVDLKAQKYSKETVKKIKKYSSGFFTYAMALKLVDSNPAQLVKLPRRFAKAEKERITPTEAEAQKLRVALADPNYAPCYEMMVLSACTSIHHSELTALRWKRVNLTTEVRIVDGKDLPSHSVSVMESFYRGEFGAPKNRKRVRIDAIPAEVVSALVALRARSKHTGPEDLVFCDGDGQPLAYDHTKLLLDKACAKAGVRVFGWHSFRRYFSTQADRKGMKADDVQRSMGHSSAMMTQHYQQEDLSRRRPSVEAIASGLFAEPDKPITNSSPTRPSSEGV